jgi:hypothetical protein
MRAGREEVNEMKMNVLDWITGVLVIVGAINWGLVGIFDYNVVTAILGDMTMLTRTVYVLVGVSGLYMIYSLATKSMTKE